MKPKRPMSLYQAFFNAPLVRVKKKGLAMQDYSQTGPAIAGLAGSTPYGPVTAKWIPESK